MTKNSKEKKAARERAAAMGVNYTEALRHIRAEKEVRKEQDEGKDS